MATGEMKDAVNIIADQGFRNAEIIRIVDGDTVEAMVELWHNFFWKIAMRLHGVNAPERFTNDGKEASQFANEHLLGKKVVIQSAKTEKYGRLLADIWYTDDAGKQINFNAELVSTGHAVPYMV